MKLFAIGCYNSYGPFALIMAETIGEAYSKLESLKKGDLIGVGQTFESWEDVFYTLLRQHNMVEVKCGIYIGEYE